MYIQFFNKGNLFIYVQCRMSYFGCFKSQLCQRVDKKKSNCSLHGSSTVLTYYPHNLIILDY